jgi:hypothetical protein
MPNNQQLFKSQILKIIAVISLKLALKEFLQQDYRVQINFLQLDLTILDNQYHLHWLLIILYN